MSLRATEQVPVHRSLDTVADLETVDVSFLVAGDDAWTQATEQRWVYQPDSVAALTADVRPTASSNGGAERGRWVYYATAITPYASGGIYRENDADTFALDGTQKIITGWTAVLPPAVNITASAAGGTLATQEAGVYSLICDGEIAVSAGTVVLNVWLFGGGVVLPGTTRQITVTAGVRERFCLPFLQATSGVTSHHLVIEGPNTGGTFIVPYANFSIVRQVSAP